MLLPAGQREAPGLERPGRFRLYREVPQGFIAVPLAAVSLGAGSSLA